MSDAKMGFDKETGFVFKDLDVDDGTRLICMPLQKNIREKFAGGKEVHCPNCGQACWEVPVPAKISAGKTIKKLCTACVIKFRG
jgi:hypothetical protein